MRWCAYVPWKLHSCKALSDFKPSCWQLFIAFNCRLCCTWIGVRVQSNETSNVWTGLRTCCFKGPTKGRISLCFCTRLYITYVVTSAGLTLSRTPLASCTVRRGNSQHCRLQRSSGNTSQCGVSTPTSNPVPGSGMFTSRKLLQCTQRGVITGPPCFKWRNITKGASDWEAASDWGRWGGTLDWRKWPTLGEASDYSDRAALLLMFLQTAAIKEHLIKLQIIFRFADSAFHRLYCLKFWCK